MMNVEQALAFVRAHGVVLVSARGGPPTLTEAIVGAPIRGSWWGHPEGRAIFAVLQAVSATDDVLVCRLAEGKVTLVQRALWPALVAAAALLPPERLHKVVQQHTAAGRHENHDIAYPLWVPGDVLEAARALEPGAALATLNAYLARRK